MKKIHFFASIFVLFIFMGCTKENDVINLSQISAPSDISAKMTIQPDNSGKVTFLPKGTGITQFKIYFGDVTANPVVVSPGNTVDHVYLEGSYQVKIVGMTVDGKTTEVIQNLMVTFFAPTNLVATIAVQSINTLAVNVSAKADFETGFKVYFGDVPNEVPTNCIQDEIITHTYAAAGTYLVTVVAVTGGAASTTYTQNVTVVVSIIIAMPLDFESPTLPYAFSDFAGENTSVIANPHSNGINVSNKVVSTTKTAGAATYAGTITTLSSVINFSVLKKIKMKVWSPQSGGIVKLKLQNLANTAGTSIEKDVVSTVANGWQEMTFDFTGINNSNNYQSIVLFFNFGVTGTGTTYYFDDIKQSN